MMHPFFRYGLGNSSQGNQSRKDGPSRAKSPTGSYDDEEEEECNEGNNDRRISFPQSLQQRLESAIDLNPAPAPKKKISVPVIKVDDQVVFSGRTSSKPSSNENRKRLGPNKNNIILETLQNDLKGKK